MSKSITRIWSSVSTVLVVIVVVFALFLMGSRIIGFRVFNVISGSMEPNYSVGDLIYVKEVDVTEIKVKDPITFVMNENLVVATHRVERIEEKEGELYFYTKGDANKDPDQSPVHYKNVIGVPVFAIPYLGYVSDYIQNPPGMYVAIALGVLLIILVFLPDFMGKKKKEPEAEAAPSVEAPAAAPAETPAAPVEAAEPTVPEEPKASIVITDQNASENGADDNTNA